MVLMEDTEHMEDTVRMVTATAHTVTATVQALLATVQAWSLCLETKTFPPREHTRCGGSSSTKERFSPFPSPSTFSPDHSWGVGFQ